MSLGHGLLFLQRLVFWTELEINIVAAAVAIDVGEYFRDVILDLSTLLRFVKQSVDNRLVRRVRAGHPRSQVVLYVLVAVSRRGN